MEGKAVHHILIVSETQSFLLVSLTDKLKEASYEVTTVHADMDEISKLTQELDLIFIFIDEELLKQHQGLVYLKDKAVEEDIPIFVTGGDEELESIKQNIPARTIKQELPRPLNVAETAQSIVTYMKTEGKQNKKKILVVDDSGAMLRNVKGWLEEKYQVILANSGAMAIKYMSTNRPDLVLLDYEMPVVDGKQVLEMIRSEMDFCDIPVIFLTSKSDKESVMQVMALKPEGYLLKTMPPAEIRKSVDDFFERRKG